MSTGRNLLLKVCLERRTKDFGTLNPEWFVQDEKELYERIRSHMNSYGQLPDVGLLNPEGGTLPEEPFAYFKDAVVERHIENVFIDKIGPKVNGVLSSGKNRKELVGWLQSELMKLQLESSLRQEVLSLANLEDHVLETIENGRHLAGMVGVPTGWPTLDSATNGFQKGDIYVIVARPKIGKSMALIRMANVAYESNAVPMFISMEMTRTQCASRLVALRTGFSSRNLSTGQVSMFGERYLRERLDGGGGRPFYYIEGQLRKDITELQSIILGHRPDVVFIDGGYLIKVPRAERMARWEKMTEIIESLKSLAITADVPLVITFQLTREVQRLRASQEVGLEHIQLSDAIGQIASVVIAMFERGPESRRIDLIGGRSGEGGTFCINWDWTRMNFDESGTFPIEVEPDWEDTYEED